MIHNADIGRGVLGVVDVSTLMVHFLLLSLLHFIFLYESMLNNLLLYCHQLWSIFNQTILFGPWILQDDEEGHVWVLNSKQGFQDCEPYAKLEEWLGSKVDEYWDENFDRVDLVSFGIFPFDNLFL